MHDEVGSVIATVTENLGGAHQRVSLVSDVHGCTSAAGGRMPRAAYDAWGKQRPTTGANAYTDPVPGTYFTPTPVGQHEGYAGHEDMDPGLVDMEGRVYDPEVGMFLSPDPNVQYPFSSQGYSRYTYVNDNPLSLSDPSGYFMLGGFLSTGDPMAGFFPQQYGQVIGIAGPIVGAALNVIPVCEGWCDYLVTAVSQAQSGYLETGNIGVGLRSGALGGAEAFAFSYVGGQYFSAYGSDLSSGELLGRSVVEGLVGGAFSSAGGGRFSDGFIGAFVGSESSAAIGSVYTGTNYYSTQNIALRTVLAGVVGGTASRLTGGNFVDGAMAAAFQRLFNDEYDKTVFNEFRATLAAKYPNFSEQYPIESKAWQTYASGFSVSDISSDSSLEYYAMVWQGFNGYLANNAEPILGQMYGDWESHQLITDYLSVGLASFLDIPSAAELVTASKEFYTIQISGPQIINEATFKDIFGLSYGQLLPNH
ncbi:MAG: RHS repeat-associated core domain-containing protein [Gammaproteobacteria bacterium]